jgi:hypothetical protein
MVKVNEFALEVDSRYKQSEYLHRAQLARSVSQRAGSPRREATPRLVRATRVWRLGRFALVVMG